MSYMIVISQLTTKEAAHVLVGLQKLFSFYTFKAVNRGNYMCNILVANTNDLSSEMLTAMQFAADGMVYTFRVLQGS